MSEKTLPGWPKRDSYHPLHVGDLPYERARADAALARLRVAVEALNRAKAAMECLPSTISWDMLGGGTDDDAIDEVDKALSAIGPLPDTTP